jgi:dCMP deaminase
MRIGTLQKKDKYYMDLAMQVRCGSKCVRAQYGTVIVSALGHIVATGYNGKPAGSCNDGICYREGLPPNSPKENCCIHSEANAIMFSDPLQRKGGTLYVSGIPCKDCALLIMQSGVSRLVYFNGAALSGHRGSSDPELWDKYGCEIEIVPFTDEAFAETFACVPPAERKVEKDCLLDQIIFHE